MSSASSSDLKLEIGHVLFIDIVGYSKLLITDQSELLQKLKEIVWGTEQFRLAQAEGKLLRLPTGDGGALVFRNNPEAPVLGTSGGRVPNELAIVKIFLHSPGFLVSRFLSRAYTSADTPMWRNGRRNGLKIRWA